MSPQTESFCRLLKIEHPIIGGAMYPCSNPELVGAVSEAGGMGVIQPLSLTYVHGYPFKAGLQKIRSMTQKPIGMNALIEASSQIYLERMKRFVGEALDEGVSFLVTALGKPDWVVRKAEAYGAVVFHDVTAKSWAQKALDAGVHGLICVNNRAGGHAGDQSPAALYHELQDLGVPLICAGGIGGKEQFDKALELGYSGVQIGTRLIATQECNTSEAYKEAIVNAGESDIALTERLTGVPVSVIVNEASKKLGFSANGIEKWLLKNPKTKHWMRTLYSLRSFRDLKKSIRKPQVYKDVWQAGRSVSAIHSVMSVQDVFNEFLGKNN